MTETDLISSLKPLIDSGLFLEKNVKNIKLDGDSMSFTIELGYAAATLKDDIARQAADAVRAGREGVQVAVEVAQKILTHAAQKHLKPLRGVKNVIAVASGKGGVGKSTTAVNLALALVAEGARVGIVDADVYGPSIPTMLNLTEHPTSKDGETMEPIERYGLKAMSIGLLIDADTPMIWRGPMATSALEQLIQQTNWGELDYLVVDLPPGTGDIQLTLAQRIPVTAAAIVTTPQDVATIDARKAYRMFEKTGVACAGVIENMSVFICPHCGQVEHIFGEGGAKKMCADYGIPLLGQLPLSRAVREEADAGKPTVIAEPDSETAKIYRSIARNIGRAIAKLPMDFSSKFPEIVVETVKKG